MSKNTGTSELINYFDLGANGDVGIAGSLDVNTIANATTDTDKFLVSDTGIIKYRTGTQLLTDIGAAPATGGSYLPLAGGTMTGNVDWAQTDRGLTWLFNTDGASIKFYNTGDGDTDSRLEFVTLDNNDEYFRWGHLPSGGGSFYESMRLRPVSSGNAELIVTGKIIKSGGTSSQFLMADGSVSTLTNPVTGTGTTNYLPKFTGASTIGNSIVFDNGTNIGIGTATPTNYGASYRTLQLDATSFPVLNLSASGVNQFLIVGSTTETLLGTFTNTPLIFYTNSVPQMRITQGGNVGIGTTVFPFNPRLAVNTTGQNAISIQTTDTAEGSTGTILYIGTGATTGNSTYGIIRTLGNGGTSAANLVLQPTGGNVLIGTATDSGYKLDVAGTIRSVSATPLVVSMTSNPGNDAIVAARWTNGVGMEMRYLPDFAQGFIDNTYQVTAGQPYGDIYFRQNVSGTMTTRMTIKADGGRVGIGTTSPAGRLSVNDAVYGEYLRVATGVIGGNQTSVFLAWNNGGNITLQQVTVGAADSGGTGFRLLRIPNT